MKTNSRERVVLRVATGCAIAHYRTLKGWTQGKLSERLADTLAPAAGGRTVNESSLDDSTISSWETGRNLPSPRHLNALRELFPQWELGVARFFDDALVRARMQPDLTGEPLRRFLTVGSTQVVDRPIANPHNTTVQLSGNTREARPARVADASLDPKCWIVTNHSDPRIVLTPVDAGDFRRVADLVKRHYRRYCPNPRSVEKFSNTLDGQVYLVTDADSDRRAIIVKFVRGVRTSKQMRALARVQHAVKTHNIFRKYSGYVLPLQTESGDSWIPVSEKHPAPISAFFCMDEVRQGRATHFQGESRDEIEDVGRKFAQINNILVSSALAPNPFRIYPVDPAWWERILKQLEAGPERTNSQTLALARTHRDFIKRTFEDVTNLIEPKAVRDGSYPITLSDLHPRNVFTLEGECVLIYEYQEARNDWPEVANLMFSAHRFCREYVRKRFVHDGSAADRSPRENAQRAAKAFLRGYGIARPREVIEQAVAAGTTWAKAVNFSKLVANFAYELEDTEDPIGRNKYQHFTEALKFLAYIRELDELEKMDWLLLVRERLLS